ncbi:hypothetical protein GCM10010178_43110 [Lentzea flava]|uniref:Carbohydrate binding domain-containing protein n=1 Tax=Lentzea flava TaxID=103732 RepID=A0ABQ2UQ18_9PSEU|nr:hypothetical protein [Lentzea flava]GGU45960.1 hypothetical protein GCM10010178_43110 [Lentzea flava]
MAIKPMEYAVRDRIAKSTEYNNVVDNVRDLDARLGPVTAAAPANARLSALEANQGTRGTNGTIYAEIDALKASPPADAVPNTCADDTALYGDTIASRPRSECWWAEPVSNGYLTIAATRSTKTFTATDLRFCIPAAAAGSGTFDLKLYTGTTLANLTERATVSGASWVASAGVKHAGLSNISITKGSYVAVGFLCTGFTTSPKFSSTAVGTGAQILISETPYSVWKSGQALPLPGSLNITDSSWTRSNQQFWFALA